jgi:flagellar hook-length control protein FliK
MINIPPIKQSTPLKTEVITELTRTWKVGQVLNATTQRGGEALSTVLIRVGQQTIEAKTPVALENGQELKLQIKSLLEFQGSVQVNKLPLLSIIEISPFIPENNKIAALKLRQFIAIQQTFSQLQSGIKQLLSDYSNSETLPASIKKNLNNLQSTLLLNQNGINPTQIKQQILNSGVFLESKILNPSNSSKPDSGLISDFKYQLLTLKSDLSQILPSKETTELTKLTTENLQPLLKLIKQSANSLSDLRSSEIAQKLFNLLPKESLIQLSTLLNNPKSTISIPEDIQTLEKLLVLTFQQQGNQQIKQLQEQLKFRLALLDLNLQVEQSISKITSLQLQPLIREGDNLILLLFNMVFKDNNENFDVNFKLQQESNSSEQNDESWNITLSFNFNNLGLVQSKIHLTGTQVSCVFYTELSVIAEKIHQLLPLLESGFSKSGLTPVNLSVINKLPNNEPLVNSHINLLDENA